MLPRAMHLLLTTNFQDEPKHKRPHRIHQENVHETQAILLESQYRLNAIKPHKSQITNHSKMNYKSFNVVLLLLLLTLLISPHAHISALGRTSAANQHNITAINAQDLVRSSNNDHQYEASHLLQHHHTQLPSNYVKLGNNTSSGVRNFMNNQHPSRAPPSSLVSIANQSMTTFSDPSQIDESQSSQQRKGIFEKICIGTSNRISGRSNKTEHYQTLVERYRNCTYVIGNLEITWLERGHTPLDLSFLENIREITGYLLFAYVKVEKISMPNLQIIRGRELLKLSSGEEFAMFAFDNDIVSLEMPNLREIITGDVGFFNNRNFCYIRTIDWAEILNTGYSSKFKYDGTVQPQQDCPKCHDSCPSSCWGPGSEMCQKFSKLHCSPQCEKGRCFGTAPRECCHLFCAGGCTGPKQTDCLACKNFNNDGECIQECPSKRKYNPSRFEWEEDPNGKFAFGATCVKECPANLLRDNGACVRSCPPDKRDDQGECVPCIGPCPKNCQGVEVVNSRNIEQFVGCTEIQGSITILDTSFNGYADVNKNHTMGARYEPMHPSRLKVFENIRVITGYLNIQAAHRDFKDLSFLSKLESIEGRRMMDMTHSLSIIKTSLVSLNLRSLKRVRGVILIKENKDMCFAHATQFVKNGIAKMEDVVIDNNGDEKRCRSLGLKCHEQCGSGSCWGSGQDECVSCLMYKLDDYCVQNCNATKQIGILSFDLGNRTCSRCHAECKDGCSGSDAKSCRACRNYKDGPYCVSECPRHKFNDTGICQECNKNCVDGCTGLSSRLGAGGCNSCDKTLIDSISPVLTARCLKVNESCPQGYYQEYGAPVDDGHPLKSLERKPICRKCHTRCKSCNGYGTHKDVCECAGYVANDQCEDSCPRDFYADDKTRRCIKCSSECNGCYGPSEADCLNCRVYRIYYDSNGPVAAARVAEKTPTGNKRRDGNYNCTSQCPPDKPHRISESNLLDPYCSEDPGPDLDSPRIVSLGSTSFLFLLITSASITFCVMVYKCKTDKDKLSTVKLTMRLSGFDDVEPLNQSNLKPNLAPLRSIKETELRKGDRIGSGVGGTVYQGLWYPEGQEHKDPTPVAIKVLRDNGQPNMNKEFLDEAYIMASVNHPNLVKLLAVCMTPTQLILVTPLMPIGCLLDYVQKNQGEITSKNLLEWGKQIAKGMAYLEERRMVHRDLALRNVLLQTKHRALISDFGLAKFLEVDQNEYKVAPSGGTCLPIKWLAPECIRERKFTHKSDVWAFGVTIWELVTFGERPFKKIPNNEVCIAIEEGARLKQPSHVSAEVYKVMYACWFYNPDERPNFKSLAETFCNFARDPERYLICNSDISVRSSESEENDCINEYNSESNSVNDETSTPSSALPTKQASNHQHNNQPPMEFEFTTRHHHSGSETPTFLTSMNMYPNIHHRTSDDVFTRSTRQMSDKSSNGTIIDPNNNFNANNLSMINGNRSTADSCWTVNHTVSTNSLGQRSVQPTDSEDYLIPSPCSNEDKFSKWPLLNERHLNSRLPPRPPSSHDPPHSAGLIGISNHEYFLTRMTYGNSNGATNASSGHIPQSLV